MKQFTTFFSLIMFFLQMVTAQLPVPYGGFDAWETDLGYISFPPYQSSNAKAMVLGDTVNVYAVAGEYGGMAVHLETIRGYERPVPGRLTLGREKAGRLYGGIPGQVPPQAINLRMRYNIQPEDEGLIRFVFRSAAEQIINTANVIVRGRSEKWSDLYYEFPETIGNYDTLMVIFSSSNVYSGNSPAIGSWMEIDTLFFSSDQPALPNRGFWGEQVYFYQPKGWFVSSRLLHEKGFLEINAIPNISDCMFSSPYSLGLKTLDIRTDTIPGFAFNGQAYIDGQPKGGQPWQWDSTSPSLLNGRYQYDTSWEGDTGVVSLTVWKWDAEKTVKEEATFVLKLSPSPVCEPFLLPFTLEFVPDSFRIYLASSDINQDASQARMTPGSVLHVDELAFDVVSNVDRPLFGAHTDVTVFPNPTHNQIVLQIEPGQPYPQTVAIYDRLGRKKQEVDVLTLPQRSVGSVMLPLKGFASGAYFLILKEGKGNVSGKARFFVR